MGLRGFPKGPKRIALEKILMLAEKKGWKQGFRIELARRMKVSRAYVTNVARDLGLTNSPRMVTEKQIKAVKKARGIK